MTLSLNSIYSLRAQHQKSQIDKFYNFIVTELLTNISSRHSFSFKASSEELMAVVENGCENPVLCVIFFLNFWKVFQKLYSEIF